MTTPIYQSHLMSVYNTARAAANTGKLEIGRVNRAFGILQTNEQDVTNHHATTKACSCKDAKYGNVCKHRIARMMQIRIGEREDADNYKQRYFENARMK